MQLEIVRIYHLSDRWLAEELLRLARRCREEYPRRLKEVDRNASYESSLVWDVVPEVAKRLGSRSLMMVEASDPKIVACDTAILREYAGICIKFSNLKSWIATADRTSAASLLVRDFCSGNPIAIALDRLQPANEEDQAQDIIAREMREWSRKNCVEEVCSWRPGLVSKIG